MNSIAARGAEPVAELNQPRVVKLQCLTNGRSLLRSESPFEPQNVNCVAGNRPAKEKCQSHNQNALQETLAGS